MPVYLPMMAGDLPEVLDLWSKTDGVALNESAVAPEHRRQGLGKKLVDLCLVSLAREGIQKCNALVYCHNVSGRRFWEQMGFRRRDDLEFWQRMTS
ncbi:MAG: GNAT family N-acetyltransferase [Pirellulales bacterium]